MLQIPDDIVNEFGMFKMKQPINFTPSRDTLISNHPQMKRICDLLEADMGKAFTITSPSLFKCINSDVTIPHSPHHVLGIFALNVKGEMLVCSVCGEDGTPAEQEEQVTHVKVLARVMKKCILQVLSDSSDLRIIHIHIACRVYRFKGSDCIQPSPDIVSRTFCSDEHDVDVIKKGVARLLLLHKQGSLFDAVGDEFSIRFSPHQIAATLECTQHPISIITGAPGTGKSLVLQELCGINGKDKSLYFCLTKALTERVNYYNKTDAIHVKNCYDIVDHLGDPQYKDRTLIAIDDAQNLAWDDSSLSLLCGKMTEKCLTVALDSLFHDFQQGSQFKDLTNGLVEQSVELYGVVPYQKPLKDIFRNSEVVTHYMKSGFADTKKRSMVSHTIHEGDDVGIISAENMHMMDGTNGILKHVQDLLTKYEARDIAVLLHRNIDVEITSIMILRLFARYIPTAAPQPASYPATGIVVASLADYIGIDSQVIVCPVWEGSEALLDNPKFRCAVASRGVVRVDFLQSKIDHKLAKIHGLDQVSQRYRKDTR